MRKELKMNRITVYFEKNTWILYGIAIILFFPALLINLGLFPLISDEHIRGLVALEMLIRDEYVIPSMYGEYYLKKPPLFNWILIGFINLFGNIDEFTLRLPTVVSTLLFAISIFFYTRKHYSTNFAFVNTIIFITCGRMLFWDTQLALIDITFSWIVFISFMVIYNRFRKGNYLLLFVISYFLMGVGYMFKGLPAIVFQGTTLLVFFAYNKQFKKLFTWHHVAGIMVFVLFVGTYYLVYLSRFEGNAGDIFTTLFGETTRRTVIRFGWERTIHHFVLFPFDMLYHFLPWSLLIIFIINFKRLGKLFTIPRAWIFTFPLMAGAIAYTILYKSYAHHALMLIPVNLVLFLLAFRSAMKNELVSSESLQIKYTLLGSLVTIPLILTSFFIAQDGLLFRIIQYSVSIIIFVALFITIRFIVDYKKIFADPFIKFNAIIFIANIVVYWTSPEVHPRYILMLAPLAFIVYLAFYEKAKIDRKPDAKIIEMVFFVLSIIVTMGIWSLLFLKETRDLDQITLKTIVLFLGLAVFTLLYYYLKPRRLLIFGIILLIVRIGFNWAIMEPRYLKSHEKVSREGAIELSQRTGEGNLYLYKESYMDDFGAFYITREKDKLLSRKYEDFNKTDYYIVDEKHRHEQHFDSLFQYRIVWEKKPVTLARIRNDHAE